MPDGNTFANSIGPAHPAGVDQPALRAVALDLTFEQLCIFIGMMDHERCAETRREGNLRFFAQADFCSRYFGSVSADELVQRLIRRKPCNRWHHATSVARQ